MKTTTLGEIFGNNEDEFKQLLELAERYDDMFDPEFHRALVKFLEPKMERINERLGQENDIDYIAYCLAYVLHVGRKG